MSIFRGAVAGVLCAESIAVGGAALWFCTDAAPQVGSRLTVLVALLSVSAFCATLGASLARGEPFRGGLLEGLMAFAVPFGGAVAAAVVVLTGALPRKRHVFHDRLKDALEGGAGDDAPFDWQSILALERELRARPVDATLRHADLEQTQDAFIRLWRGRGTAGIEIVKRALDHADPDVRLRARILLIRLQDRAVTEFKEASAAAAADPENSELRKRGGRACVLLSRIDREPETAHEFRRRAVQWLREANRLDPDDGDVLLDLASVAMVDDPEGARESFRAVMRQRPEDLGALAGSAECSYRLGWWGSLSEECEAILERAPEGSAERAAAEFFMSRLEEASDECWVDA